MERSRKDDHGRHKEPLHYCRGSEWVILKSHTCRLTAAPSSLTLLCMTMRRRDFLKFAPVAALPVPAFQSTPSKMKITGVRLVQVRPKRPVPPYKPAAGSWSTGGVEVANPMSIYPEYKAMRSLFQPDPGKLGGFTVEISTDKGVKGYGEGGIAGGQIVEQHLTKLLLNEDPFNVERLWDICGDRPCTTAAPDR